MKIKYLHKLLKSLADPKYRKNLAKFGIDNSKTFGVRKPELVKISQLLSAELKNLPPKQIVSYLERLWADRWSECRALAIMLLKRFASKIPDNIQLQLVLKWVKDIRDWADCDSLVCHGLKYWIQKNPNRALSLAAKLVKSKQRWMVRFGLVMIIPLTQKSFKGQLDVGKAMDIINLARNNKDRYVKKAVDWALRELRKC